MIRRREFITQFGGAAVVWPVAARAQQAAMPVIGFLSSTLPDQFTDRVRLFREGLREVGYVEGQNVLVEYRWAENRNERLAAMAAELSDRRVNVIVATTGAAALAAKTATATIPIVFYVGSDPIRLGLVPSLNRPSGNLTGMSNLSADLSPKRLELLYEVLSRPKSIGALVNPATADAGIQEETLKAAAQTLGLRLEVMHASNEGDFETVFAKLTQLQVAGLVSAADTFFTSKSQQLAALTVRHKMPAAFEFREFATGGGLMSYGGSFTDLYRQVGTYAGRILKGEKPADLPVQRNTKAELLINLRAAKELGLTVPLSLLGRADEVIE